MSTFNDAMHAMAEAIAEIEKLRKQNAQLAKALKPFVAAYEKAACPVGDSDLYPEQPRSVSVTLGDCRTAAAVLHYVEKENAK